MDALQPSGTVIRIDPAANSTAAIELDTGAYLAKPVGEFVWVLDFDGQAAWFIDPGAG